MTGADSGEDIVPRVPAPRSPNGGAPSAAHYSSVRFIDCTQVAPEAWANGAGITRTIASRINQEGNIDWRISLATLDGAARFSRFPGVDRIIVPVDNSSVELHAQDGHLVAHPLVPAHFPGDLQVWATDIVRPTHVLNVMTRRVACRATVTVATHSRRVTTASTHLLICASGQWRFSSTALNTQTLLPMQGLWLDGRSEELDLSSVALDARLISIALEPVEY
ncbi:HutD family protein [Burkholderia sp. Tr-862]|uniref:HutD/Ves family protein n=1 Tax=Burkholderia sp. Tr-862 TaxID=2608331 RepID=UPI0014199EF3|nr:HutD family protein [Burkholderia sp. Tr-862]NIF43277.1 HutD family protein [Burkholderia sp. Tr-862]